MRLLVLVAAAMVAATAGMGAGRASIPSVRVWTISYRAHTGEERPAYVLLPAWYGPRYHPPLPLVISPHGRGIDARRNVAIWGNLPVRGPFAVVNPEGQGRRLELYSWGDRGQVADLARMPSILHRALPWLEIDRRRIYVFGGSMGGQEALLLAARYPDLLAGAAAFDAPTNLALRYRDFVFLRHGRLLRERARIEFGGTPGADPRAYAARSPLDLARQLAYSGVPLQIWWSLRDRVVVDQRAQSGLLCRRILAANPNAPLVEIVGFWRHTMEMRWNRRLPEALSLFGLLAPSTGSQYTSAASAASTSSSVL